MSAIKPRPTPPFGHQGRVPTLVVRHPHYPDYNTLVKLPALDHGDTVDYDAALIICGIISDNSWSTGWFARSADGSNVCERGAPLVAADGDVFYFVSHRTCQSQPQSIRHGHAPLTVTFCRQIPRLRLVGSLART
ncbi:hypothetical protein GQ44DRAFT_720509 [Phaeosphaeriaceae sp. PMI808]|nr:hypothetical protein GQ44DRAFT_720509 [Phaeosphaeriaceae sp. PMI808]